MCDKLQIRKKRSRTLILPRLKVNKWKCCTFCHNHVFKIQFGKIFGNVWFKKKTKKLRESSLSEMNEIGTVAVCLFWILFIVLIYSPITFSSFLMFWDAWIVCVPACIASWCCHWTLHSACHPIYHHNNHTWIVHFLVFKKMSLYCVMFLVAITFFYCMV